MHCRAESPISAFEIFDRPIAYHRSFVRLGAGVTGAVLLSQVVYWSKRTIHKGGWFYKTQAEWQDETGLTRSELEGARKKLLITGVIEYYRKGVPAKGWYRINMQILQLKLLKTCNPDCGKPANCNAENLQSITENTTETTTENPLTPKGGSAKAQDLDKAKAVVDLYNEMTKGKFAGVRALDQSRIRAIAKANKFKFDDKSPFSDYNLDAYERYFELALSNPFNCGQNDRGWRANFDYLMRPKTMLTILEAHYA